jgi:hypothetical protein
MAFKAALVMVIAALPAFPTPVTGTLPRDKKPPKPPASKPVRKPAAPPRPVVRLTREQAQRPVVTHAHWTAHRGAHVYYPGRSARSRAWYYHHRHQRWVYQVRYRIGGSGTRVFTSHAAARTFRVWLGRHHLHSHLYHQPNGLWAVTFWGSHTHPFGTYASLPVARRVELALRQQGFPSWVHWLRVYF